jgi:DNA-binding winged helix-turn-helix (wHTH) protein/Tfp pilus assembly protein PilF
MRRPREPAAGAGERRKNSCRHRTYTKVAMNPYHREETGDARPQRLLFEGFELRLDSGELLRTGSPVRLQPKPAKILEILACRSGEVVHREEIRQLVWGDSHVDFDASLNFCIKEIRRALGDSATSPRFVETVPRRGYRFLKPVTVAFDGEPLAAPAAVPLPPPLPPRPAPRRSRLLTLFGILGLLLLLTLLVGSRAAGKRPGAGTKPSPASESYLRGIYLLQHEQIEPATAAFEEAVLLDPGFAPAYAALAQARLKVPATADLAATEAAARHALALDPDLAEGHLVLGHILLFHDRDWAGAGRELREALALAPGSADAHHEYSLYLAALGRNAEAIAAVRRARELDPGSMLVGSDYAWYFYLDHQYAEAIRQGRITLGLYPLSAATAPKEAQMAKFFVNETLLNSAWALGDPETARGAAKTMLEIMQLPQAAEQLRGAREFWQGREQRIQETLKKMPLDPLLRAKNATSLGERDRALDLLTRQCAPQGLWMPFAAVEPVLDPLHSDPRWSQVLDCLKLPADAPARRL